MIGDEPMAAPVEPGRGVIQPGAWSFVGHLVWTLPDLAPVFEEHLSDQGGTLLPHVFMADVERWAESVVDASPAIVEALLDELAVGWLRGGDAVANLIEVSFVENLPYPDEPAVELRSMLPASLAALLRH